MGFECWGWTGVNSADEFSPPGPFTGCRSKVTFYFSPLLLSSISCCKNPREDEHQSLKRLFISWFDHHHRRVWLTAFHVQRANETAAGLWGSAHWTPPAFTFTASGRRTHVQSVCECTSVFTDGRCSDTGVFWQLLVHRAFEPVSVALCVSALSLDFCFRTQTNCFILNLHSSLKMHHLSRKVMHFSQARMHTWLTWQKCRYIILFLSIYLVYEYRMLSLICNLSESTTGTSSRRIGSSSSIFSPLRIKSELTFSSANPWRVALWRAIHSGENAKYKTLLLSTFNECWSGDLHTMQTSLKAPPTPQIHFPFHWRTSTLTAVKHVVTATSWVTHYNPKPISVCVCVCVCVWYRNSPLTEGPCSDTIFFWEPPLYLSCSERLDAFRL